MSKPIMSDNLSDFVNQLVTEAVLTERRQIAHMLSVLTHAVVEDEDGEAKKLKLSPEALETTKLAVVTFVAIFIDKLADKPLPTVNVIQLPFAPGSKKES